MANLKQITLNNKLYNYIKYEDDSTTIDTIKLTIDDDMRSFLNDLSGFMAEMLDPKDSTQMSIINIQVPIKGELTAICMPNEETKLTSAGKFMEAVKDKLANVDYKVTNSLQEIYDHPEYELNFILEQYVNPKCVNDTGIYIKEQMINYDEQLIAKNDSVKQIIDYLITLNENNKVYKDAPITNMKFELREPNPFNMDVSVKFDVHGEPFSFAHDNITTELKRVPTKEEYDEYIERDEINTLHSYAVDLNTKINRRGLDQQQINNRVDSMWESYIREVEDNKGQYSLYISYPLLNELIEMDVIDGLKDCEVKED